MALIALLDHPKESAAQAIKELNRGGVVVKVLTGDNQVIARKTCKDVGLHVEGILLGSEIEAFMEQQLDARVEGTTIFAKLTPVKKSRISKVLRSRGHVVDFMGDGINDADALREADIVMSVDTAVDIAKESADIVLLEKSMLVLNDGVAEGRRTFGNNEKCIKIGISSAFVNMFSMLGTSIALPFLPMLPVQIVLNNLLYDFSQTGIPFDHVDPEYLEMPRKKKVSEIRRFMVVIGPVSSLFDYATFALMWFVFKAKSVED